MRLRFRSSMRETTISFRSEMLLRFLLLLLLLFIVGSGAGDGDGDGDGDGEMKRVVGATCFLYLNFSLDVEAVLLMIVDCFGLSGETGDEALRLRFTLFFFIASLIFC